MGRLTEWKMGELPLAMKQLRQITTTRFIHSAKCDEDRCEGVRFAIPAGISVRLRVRYDDAKSKAKNMIYDCDIMLRCGKPTNVTLVEFAFSPFRTLSRREITLMNLHFWD